MPQDLDPISPSADHNRPEPDRPSHPMGASLLVVGGVTLLIILLSVMSSF